MKNKKKVPQKSIEELILYNQTKFYKEFEILNFQRSYRKFFKFRILSDKIFFLQSLITIHSIRVEIIEPKRFHVTYTNRNGYIEFTALSQREFIEKLIKHQTY